MNNYDLTALARPKARVPWLALPLIEPPAGLERAYLAELRKIEQEMARLLRETVLPSFRSELVRDAEEGIWDLVSRLMASFTRGTVEKVKELLGLEGQRHTDQWKASVKKTLGIDLAAVVTKDDIGTYLDRATLRSAGLVKDFTETMVKKLQYETTQALINGGSARQLQTKLKDVLGITDRRAKIIARDQTAKFNSDLNRIRHQQAGLDEYRWRTSKDERVRERHRKLEGKLYKYSEKTDAEDGLPPGQPILCRCGAQAIVNFAAEAVQPVGPAVVTPPPPVAPPPVAPPPPRPAPKPKAPPKPKRQPYTHHDPETVRWMDPSFEAVEPGSDEDNAIRYALRSFSGVYRKGTEPSNTGGAYYNGRDSAVHMPYATRTAYSKEIWRHEFGHHLDFAMGGSYPRSAHYLPDMYSEAKKYMEEFDTNRYEPFSEDAFKSLGLKESYEEWTKNHPTRNKAMYESSNTRRGAYLVHALKNNHAASLLKAYPEDHHLADFVGAMTNNKIGYGHSEQYYKDRADRKSGPLGTGHAMEAFANYFMLATSKDKTRIEAVRRLFPKTSENFDNIIAGAGQRYDR